MRIRTATMDQCQSQYDRQLPEEHEERECPECGAEIEQVAFGVKCTTCSWFMEPDFYEIEEEDYE